MELKGHSLIITPLESHLSEMGRNVLTQHPLAVPAPPLAPWTTLEDSHGLQQLSLPEPVAPSQHALCLKRGSLLKSLETSAQISANASQIKFAILGSLVKTAPLSKFGPSQLQGLSYHHSINPGR